MYFTINDLLHGNSLPGLRLVAGTGGINHRITSLNCTDILYDPESFQAGELIFTTGYDFSNEEKYTVFFHKIHHRGISGIVLLTGRYQKTAPSYLISLANQYNTPVLTMPDAVSFPTILNTLMPLIGHDKQQSWSIDDIKKANTFFEQSVKEHHDCLFATQKKQRIRLIFMESDSYKEVSEERWNNALQQVRSFIQANTYFCQYQELSKGHFVFLVAHEPEDSPSMMYRLHLKLISLSETKGVSFLLGNEYYSNSDHLSAAIQRAMDGLNTLHGLNAKRGVCTYESIQFLRMLSYFYHDHSPIFLENQAFKLLHCYDDENHTEYMNTLRIYLSSNCNIARTSKLLFIHRNTLLNRLEKITAISGIRLEDYYARIYITVALMLHDYFSP